MPPASRAPLYTSSASKRATVPVQLPGERSGASFEVEAGALTDAADSTGAACVGDAADVALVPFGMARRSRVMRRATEELQGSAVTLRAHVTCVAECDVPSDQN